MRSITNTHASEMIPIRLILSISVIGVITFFALNGIQQYNHTLAEDEFHQHLSIIKNNLDALIATGNPRDITTSSSPSGTIQKHTLVIPSEITYISFGIPSFIENSTKKDILSSNGIYYSSQQSGDTFLWYDQHCPVIKAKYNEQTKRWFPNWDEPVLTIQKPGKTILTFELISNHSSCFVLVYEQMQ